MVSRKLLYPTHKRLIEIVSPLQDVSFGRNSVLVCADVYLPLFQGKSVFMFKKTDTSKGRKSKLAELTQMGKIHDSVFTGLLNKVNISTIEDGLDDT